MNKTNNYVYHILVTAALSMIGIGTVVYRFIENWSWVDAYYFSVVTLATVGYGDLHPTTTFGKIFTTFYILIGVGIIGAFANQLIKKRGSKMQARIDKHKQ